MGDPRLDILAVAGQGELEAIVVGIQFMEPGEHIFRIFCPEYDAVDDRRGQAYLADLMETERVTDIQEALFYPVIKPIGVMIGQVGPAAGAQYRRKILL